MAETKIVFKVNTLSRTEIEKSLSLKVGQLQAVSEIDSQEVREFAYEMVTKARKEIKMVEHERKKITVVFDSEKKKFMELEKDMVKGITLESERVALLVGLYDKLMVEIANKEAERYNEQIAEQRRVIEEAEKELNEIFGDSEPAKKSSLFIDLVEMPKAILPKGSTGTKAFRVLDFDKIPNVFKILDESKVRQAMKEGIEIEGIEYYLEQKTTFR